MKQDEISILWQRYLDACKKHTEPYFDADEIDALLDSFEEKDDFTHYEPILKLGLRQHPDSSDLKIRQCKFHMHNEEYKKALDLLGGVVEFNDLDTDMIRLECYCALGMYPKVVEYMEELIQSEHPQTTEVFEFLAPVLSDLEMIDEAKEFIQWGLQISPDSMILKDELCYIHEVNGDLEDAINVCNELIDTEPYSYDYWFTLGRLYSLTSDFNNAIDAFDFALTCDDSDEDLKVLKAYCLFMNENYQKALEVYSELADNVDSAIHVKAMKAECYIRLDDFDKAYNELKEVINTRTDETPDPSIYINFIRSCVATDRKSEAVQMLLKAARIFPNNVRILSMLALDYIESGKDELAIQITGKILQRMGQTDYDGEGNADYRKLFEGGKNPALKDILESIAECCKNILEINPHLSLKGKYIPPEDLSREYLSNKNNSN
ncbi:MAG: multidrug transporter [Tannerellaceae bacterium]|jgi:tetratricopeptide (TPR) repeat protein|nr:multidrug transporter [Tannerellaceae bacterium]